MAEARSHACSIILRGQEREKEREIETGNLPFFDLPDVKDDLLLSSQEMISA